MLGKVNGPDFHSLFLLLFFDRFRHPCLLLGAHYQAGIFKALDLIEVKVALELGAAAIDLAGGDCQVLIFLLAGAEAQLCAVAEAVVEVARLIEAGLVDT
jgi:hypothetical protein